MAKCPICNTRKGKRKCKVVNDSFICSLCCGTSRDEEKCAGCVFYQAPTRKYNAVPLFSTIEMRDDYNLQECSNIIESSLSAFNMEQEYSLSDDDAIGIYELLLDKYYFKDEIISSDKPLWQQGFDYIDKNIQNDMGNVDDEIIFKVLGAARASARRRTDVTHREYMNFIEEYVGHRHSSGMRIMQRFS